MLHGAGTRVLLTHRTAEAIHQLGEVVDDNSRTGIIVHMHVTTRDSGSEL
jgi:hypothetical protein